MSASEGKSWTPAEGTVFPVVPEDCHSCGRAMSERPGSRCFRRDLHLCGSRHGGVARCDLTIGECRSRTAHDRAERVGADRQAVELTADNVLEGLSYRHRSRPSEIRQWLLVEEFPCGAGRIDLVAVNLWTSRGFELIAYEVKVSKADLAHELERPEKRACAEALATRFYLATPPGLCPPEQVPDGVGLIEVSPGRKPRTWSTREVVSVPRRERDVVDWRSFVAVAKRLRDARRGMR